MNCRPEDMLVYAVTDRAWLKGESLKDQVEKALKGGVTFVQLREKNLDRRLFLEEAAAIKELCDSFHVPFVINDDVEIALASGADGVHVGQKDMDVKEARRRLGPGKIIGVSCKTVEQAKAAEAGGADYLGVGAMYPTDTKSDTSQVTVETLKAICRAVDIPVVIVHLTNEAALREVEAARKRGQRVYVETCPQYLVLEDSVYDDPDYSRAARYVCAPPIRKERDQQALWTALRKGEIQTVSTDHCSFTLEQKDAGRGDFTKIPGGLPGVENRGELLYTYGVTTRKISLATMCRVLAENPAKLYGMFPRKGVLQDGADADIVVYDPQADHVLRAEDMASLAGYSPYEGFPIRGGIHQVWLRGRLAVEDGFVLAGPDGKYIPRGKCSL